MALIKCTNCQHDISDTLKKCIHCGTKVRKLTTKKEKSVKEVKQTVIKEKTIKNKRLYKKSLLITLVILTIFCSTVVTYYLLKDNKMVNSNNKSEDNPTFFENESEDNNSDSTNNLINQIEETSNSTTQSTTKKNTKINSLNDNTVSTKIRPYSCPSGYNLVWEGNILNVYSCIKEIGTSPKISYYCENGGKLVNDKCEITEVRTAYEIISYGCDEPYKEVNGQCQKTYYVDANQSLNCSKDERKHFDGLCYHIIENIPYSCPSGYTLKEDYCYKK